MESAAPVALALRLIHYPAWEVQVDAKRARITALPMTSQILVPLAAGDHRVELHFRRTWDRSAGGAISCLAVAALVGLAWIFRRRGDRGLLYAGGG